MRVSGICIAAVRLRHVSPGATRSCRSRCSTIGCWCSIPDKDGERRSSGGILIPATAQISKRLVWAEVVALGQNVRSAEVGDRVLFSPDDRYEVEVGGDDYIMLRERDLHAVAASRIEASHRSVSLGRVSLGASMRSP